MQCWIESGFLYPLIVYSTACCNPDDDSGLLDITTYIGGLVTFGHLWLLLSWCRDRSFFRHGKNGTPKALDILWALRSRSDWTPWVLAIALRDWPDKDILCLPALGYVLARCVIFTNRLEYKALSKGVLTGWPDPSSELGGSYRMAAERLKSWLTSSAGRKCPAKQGEDTTGSQRKVLPWRDPKRRKAFKMPAD